MFKQLSSLNQRWDAELARCIDSLEPDDQHRVGEITSYQELHAELQRTSSQPPQTDWSSEDRSRLLPSMSHLRIFSLFFSENLNGDANLKPLWGLISLLIQLASQMESGFNRLSQMLKGTARRAEIFNEYCKREATTDALTEACFDAHMSLLSLYSQSIHFFREGPVYRSADVEWEALEQIFQKASLEIDEALQRVEKLASISKEDTHIKEIRRLHNILSYPSNQSSQAHTPSASSAAEASIMQSHVSLPCIVLPASRFSFRRSYNRDEILNQLRAHFHSPSRGDGLRSIALHGVGGVGKSHCAHKYAYLESQKKTYDAILWFGSETPSAIEQSFTDVAVRLKLEGASSQNHTENKIRVLDWLQNTDRSWLLIFDNTEDPDLLAQYWPAAGRGDVIITTRNHALAFDPADKGVEVPSFAPDGGSKLLLQLLSLNISQDLTSTESKSALELSDKLRGHALAISQMAGLIHRRAWTITEFLGIYEKSSQSLNKRALDAVWRLSFEGLASETAELLGVISFVAPDSIPQALFEIDDPSNFPPTLQFFADELAFSDVLEDLMKLALVKRNKDTREFFVHRLVQAQFIDFLTPQDRQRAFFNTSLLLLKVFPASGGRYGQLYAHWATCRLYLQHVLMLAHHYKENNKTPTAGAQEHSRLRANQPFCRLLAYCSRYLIEQVSLKDLSEITELAIEAYATLGPQEQDIYLDGLIQNQCGFSWYLQGNFHLSEQYWKNALEIHKNISPPDYRAVAWRSYNMGLTTAASERYEEAVHWHLSAEQSWEKCGDDTISCLAWIRSQRAQALIFIDKFEEAKSCLDFAIPHLQESEQWGWLAFTYFAQGNLHRAQSHFRLAETSYLAAQNAWKMGDQTKIHNFYAACEFKLGCVALDQGDYDKANVCLNNARDITKLQRGWVPADYDRTINKLYELSTLTHGQPFDREILEDGKGLYETVFGVQRDYGFNRREAKFDSRVNSNWR